MIINFNEKMTESFTPSDTFNKLMAKRYPHIIFTNIESDIRHQNYLDYLAQCWSNYKGIVVSSEHFWYLILNHLAIEIKNDPETYRDWFTTSKDKEEITVLTHDITRIDPNLVVEVLKYKIKFDIDMMLPNFSTLTPNAIIAQSVCFCDMASPYYSYSCMMCNIPLIDVQGTLEDWELFENNLIKLKTIFPNQIKYFDEIINNISSIKKIYIGSIDESFWRDFFYLKNCGSGHQTEVFGWIRNFFTPPEHLAYVENFDTCIGEMEYKNLDTGKKFKMIAGLFSSIIKNGIVIPQYNYMIEDLNGEK